MKCLACEGSDLVCVLDLGFQPAANLLLQANVPAESAQSVPLVLMGCLSCGHCQLGVQMSPETLFDDYLYKSGTSKTLRHYFSWFAGCLADVLAPGSSVLEVACNDGSLVGELVRVGLSPVGVDPARNQIPADLDGGQFVCGYFPKDMPPERQFDAIVGQNVLAHTPDPFSFMLGIRRFLAPGGTAMLQVSQVEMLLNGEFDTIYHEHYSFFSPQSMTQLVERSGLRVRRLFFTNIHGVSMIAVIDNPDSPATSIPDFSLGGFACSAELEQRILDFFSSAQWADVFLTFAQRAESVMRDVRIRVERARADGRKVLLVGAAAKAITFSGVASLQVDGVLDEAPDKIGRLIPSIGLTVDPLSSLAGWEEPLLLVISAWNFRRELEEKCVSLLGGRPTQFLVYFPEIQEWNSDA